MMVLCDVSRDFLRKRVVQRVWPPLVHSLESLAHRSRNADRLYKYVSIPLLGINMVNN